jgi:hypothetical protein
MVMLNGKCGFIDRQGTLVIKPQFDDARDFSDSLCAVRIGTLWGYVNFGAKPVIELQFENALTFSEGLAAVKDTASHLWGFINKQGIMVIAPQFESVIESFNSGYASVRQNGRVGVINTSGKWVIEPKFDFVGKFVDGLAQVFSEGAIGYVDTTGNFVRTPTE